MSYAKIIRFGDSLANALPVYSSDPLTYCIGNDVHQRFNHGASNADIYGQNSQMCQIYLAQRCAQNWDAVCEKAYDPTTNEEYRTRALTAASATTTPIAGLSSSEILLLNTAHEKYLVSMAGDCQMKVEPFNPIDPASPTVAHYVGRYCVPSFAIKDPSTIDRDPVMNRILNNPRIARQLLTNIRNTMARMGTLHELRGTRLGAYFQLDKMKRAYRCVHGASDCACAGCANAARR